MLRNRARRNGQQLWNVAVGFFLVDDRGAKPDVGVVLVEVERHRQHVAHVADALGQQQPIQVGRGVDEREEVGAPLRVDGIVESARDAQNTRARAEERLSVVLQFGQ